MLRHIVMLKFKNQDSLPVVSEKTKQMLVSLESTIETLKNMEVGINISTKPAAFDLVLTADFDNEEGLNYYRTHPEHVKVLNFLKETVEKSAAVDYWT